MATETRLELQGHTHLSLAGIIVSNYVSRNTMAHDQVSAFLEQIYDTILKLAGGKQIPPDVEAILSHDQLGHIPGLSEHDVAQAAERVAASRAGRAQASGQYKTEEEIKASITPDGIISFLDNRAYKTMRRHLQTHNLTGEQYRERFGLPADYPLVAPNYSARRAALAKAQGLGSGKTSPPQVRAQSQAPELSKSPSARRRGTAPAEAEAPRSPRDRRPRA